MWTLLQASGITKIWPYLVVAGIVALIIASSYYQGRFSGQAGAKQRQLNDWLTTRYQEAKDRAAIEAMSTDAARDKLRERWTKK